MYIVSIPILSLRKQSSVCIILYDNYYNIYIIAYTVL